MGSSDSDYVDQNICKAHVMKTTTVTTSVGAPFRAFVVLVLMLMLVLVPPGVVAKSDFDMSFENCSCTVLENNEYLESANCFTGKNVRRRTFTIELLFKKDLKSFNFDLLIEMPRKGSSFTLLNETNQNGCQMLKNSNQVTLLQVARTLVNRYGNFPEECPFKQDHLYYIRGFRADLNMLPALAFEAVMNIKGSMLVKQAKILTVFLQGRTRVKKSGAVAH